MIDLKNIDCMEYLKKCDDKSFDLAIVDPPYGIGVNKMNLGRGDKDYKNDGKTWDEAAPDQDYFDELFRVSKHQIIWGPII